MTLRGASAHAGRAPINTPSSAPSTRPGCAAGLKKRVINYSSKCHRGLGRPRWGGSERHLELRTEDARFVDRGGHVVEAQRANGLFAVGAVAAVAGHFVLAVIPGVPHAQAAFEQWARFELLGLVEEEVEFAAVRPVGVHVQLVAVA